MYLEELREGSEFMQKLSIMFAENTLLNNFTKNSNFYIYQYSVPIEKIIFDFDTEKNFLNKEQLIVGVIRSYLYRLIEVKNNNYESTFNPVIRLKDNNHLLA